MTLDDIMQNKIKESNPKQIHMTSSKRGFRIEP